MGARGLGWVLMLYPTDIRARWALAWLGALVCAACILLLLLLKKEDVKGEHSEAARGQNCVLSTASPTLLPAGWLKSLHAGCGSKGE